MSRLKSDFTNVHILRLAVGLVHLTLNQSVLNLNPIKGFNRFLEQA